MVDNPNNWTLEEINAELEKYMVPMKPDPQEGWIDATYAAKMWKCGKDKAEQLLNQLVQDGLWTSKSFRSQNGRDVICYQPVKKDG